MGHIFEDNDAARTNQRHCVNDTSIQYMKFDIPAGIEEEMRMRVPSW